MRIMALGDSHGNLRFMQDALRLASKHDCGAVHVVGDFGIWTHIEAGVRFLDQVNEQARSLGVLVTFTDGNHENFDHLYEIPIDDDGWRRVRDDIWHAPRGHIWRWGEVNFLSMGGAHSIDGPGGIWNQARGPLDRPGQHVAAGQDGPEVTELPAGHDIGGWWPQETITDEEVQTAIQNMADWANDTPWGHIDVMFTHDAPSAVSLPFDGYPAAEINRARLQKVYEAAWPQLLVHGHYHMHQQFHDRSLDCLAVSLSHDASRSRRGGQYLFIDTNPFEVLIPEWT